MLTIRPLTAGLGVVSNILSAHHSTKGVTQFKPLYPLSLRQLIIDAINIVIAWKDGEMLHSL